jgi:uncharacterized protein YdaL
MSIDERVTDLENKLTAALSYSRMVENLLIEQIEDMLDDRITDAIIDITNTVSTVETDHFDVKTNLDDHLDKYDTFINRFDPFANYYMTIHDINDLQIAMRGVTNRIDGCENRIDGCENNIFDMANPEIADELHR